MGAVLHTMLFGHYCTVACRPALAKATLHVVSTQHQTRLTNNQGTWAYRIAGNFCGYKISRIVGDSVKTKFSRFLISRPITTSTFYYVPIRDEHVRAWAAMATRTTMHVRASPSSMQCATCERERSS